MILISSIYDGIRNFIINSDVFSHACKDGEECVFFRPEKEG